MTVDLAPADLVRQLRRAGLRPNERLTQQILSYQQQAVEPLLELASDVELLHADEPQCWAPIHALRLLGELRPLEIITPLLRLLPLSMLHARERPVIMWAQDLPQMLGRIGEPAIEPLMAFADDSEESQEPREAAVSALGYAAVVVPEQREAVVAWLREHLQQSDDPALAAYLVMALAQLGVRDAYREIMALYPQGRIDREVAPPADVRQWLLGNIEKRLSCVNHPLGERYDEHGPFSKEQYDMMERMHELEELDDPDLL